MMEFYHQFLNHPDFWKYISIPFVAAIVGWTTNWLAIQLTFSPIQFVGIPPWLGWQGIIPRKGKKMASIVVDNTLDKISTVQEIFDQFEPEKIAHHVIRITDYRIEELTDEIMSEHSPLLWENLPNLLKQRVYAHARNRLPDIMDNLIKDMQTNIEHLIDPRDLIIKKLSENKSLLNRMFWECGEQEFKFVINSGFVFGFLFGVIQMFVWWHFKHWSILPAFGLAVGLGTNWLALNLIFRPLNPIKLTPFGPTLHGLFLSRQNEVSHVFCHLVTTEILTIGHLMHEIFHGPKSSLAQAMMKRHLRPMLDSGLLSTVARLTVGPDGMSELKRTIENKSLAWSLASFEDPMFTRERGVVIEKMFRERMQAMSSEEFQALLRPAFEEDEWILITLGGVLGLLAGVAQLFFMFASTQPGL